jgi:hypothetical protein
VNALVIASADEHPGAARVWGTGGWTPPEEREARDWLTLCRLLGWEVRLATPALDDLPMQVGCVLIACAPGDVGEPLAGALREFLDRTPALVVAPAAEAGSALSGLAGCARCDGHTTGRTLSCAGTRWPLAHEIAAVALDGGCETPLTLDGSPAAVARNVGRGTVVTLGVHPSATRDAGGGRALSALLMRSFPRPVAWLDLDGVLVLRMDDPGGAQNVHLDPWSYTELDPATWRGVAALLRQHAARLSVAAVPAWVDDGDATRGELLVAGSAAERAPGRIHPSWVVRYRDRGGRLHDYEGEFALLRELAAEGVVDVQLHGYTHMRPDVERWARAPDRHEAVAWYRELDAAAEDALAASPSDHPLARGLDELTGFFGARPTTVIFPGDEWTNASLGRALDLGLSLAASYYLALRDDDRFCWCEHLCAPYLDEPDGRWFASGLPVVGYFHARDIATHGVGWLADLLARWSEAGATRMIGFDDLAFALRSRVGHHGGEVTVSTPAQPTRRPLDVLHSPRPGADPVRARIA